MEGKVALEEHFAIEETLGDSENFKVRGWSELRHKLLDIHDDRISEMDRHGIGFAILSLNAPVVQAITDTSQAIDLAVKTNDFLAEEIDRRPDRFAGFAALPMQDPDIAARELTRCVKELGFKGALVNGFSQRDTEDSMIFYDLPEYRPFWQTVEELDTTFYLHPRSPIPAQDRHYEGHPWFLAPAWGFAAETSIHALRLLASGLFDEFSGLKLILGHLGEHIPYDIWRIDHRLKKATLEMPAKKTFTEYFRSNIYLTTSGNFNTRALKCAMDVMGAERILFSVDYPFENTSDGTDWFDNLDIGEENLLKIGRTNAERLFNLGLI